MAIHIALGPVLHRWRTRWGANRAEARQRLPGDDLVPSPAWSYNHAITIEAPRAVVWPWLLQLGREHVEGFGTAVAFVKPERALVLGGPQDLYGSRASRAFYLLTLPDGTTRLIERGRHRPGRGVLAQLGAGPYLVDPIGFVLSRQMLKAIKRHAERGAAIPAAASVRT
jgi:hypothetical protein